MELVEAGEPVVLRIRYDSGQDLGHTILQLPYFMRIQLVRDASGNWQGSFFFFTSMLPEGLVAQADFFENHEVNVLEGQDLAEEIVKLSRRLHDSHRRSRALHADLMASGFLG
jgi:hypothetical protein